MRKKVVAMMMAAALVVSTAAVSYTHLDVYKRQGFRGTERAVDLPKPPKL